MESYLWVLVSVLFIFLIIARERVVWIRQDRDFYKTACASWAERHKDMLKTLDIHRDNEAIKTEAIENNAAHYHPKTGYFTWGTCKITALPVEGE